MREATFVPHHNAVDSQATHGDGKLHIYETQIQPKLSKSEPQEVLSVQAHGTNPALCYRDRVVVGAYTARRIRSIPSDARKHEARSVTIVEIETGCDYRISGGVEWFEVRDGIILTVELVANINWDGGSTTLGPGIWLVRIEESHNG